VESGYTYDTRHEPGYPNRRAVKWLRSVPRTSFSQGALYEIGSAMSFFQIKNFAEEFRQAVESKKPVPEPFDDATAVAHIAEDIEANTRDFILKQLGHVLKGHPLAEFVAHLLRAMGYRTRLSPEGPDGGIDIIAHRDELGVERPLVKVQVKSTEASIGDPTVTALYGKVASDEFGLFVTLGTYSNAAKNFARNKSNLRLIDGEELVSLILQHYEQFDSQYKGLLPLKKVYVPEALEEKEE
jgi:restriction system protein